MTNTEIRLSYRQAKDKTKQVEILHDLTLRTRKDLCGILGIPYTEEHLELDLADDFYDQGMLDREIGAELGWSNDQVMHWRHERGLPSNAKPTYSQEEFLELYDQGLIDREIAEIMGCRKMTVCRWRLALGLKPNGKSRQKTARTTA